MSTYTCKMIISHMNDHKQRVKISDEVSGLSTIKRGVFNIFLSNLHLIQFSGQIANYEDDNHLYNEIAVSVENLKKTTLWVMLTLGLHGSMKTIWSPTFKKIHDDVIKWKHFPRNWPFVRGINQSRWFTHTKASDAELWCLLWSASE